MLIQTIETKDIGHIEFDNTQISLIEKDNELFVPLRPICEELKLNWKNQYRNLLDDVVLNAVVVTMTTTGKDNKQYEMICIPISYINGWLFKINPARYEGERRERIIRYQKECYKALFKHFYPHTRTQLGRMTNKTEANTSEVKYMKSETAMEKQAEKEAQKVFKGQKSIKDYSLVPLLQSMIRENLKELNKGNLFPATTDAE